MGEEKGRRKKTREEQVGGALARTGALHGGCVSYHFTIVTVRYRSTDVGKGSGVRHPLLSGRDRGGGLEGEAVSRAGHVVARWP